MLCRLFFSVEAMSAMRAHSQACVPDEACGALLGRGERITEVVPLINSAPQPRIEFLIDPRALLETERAAERRGLEVIGYFHSHPASSARPSARDLAEAVPGSIAVIVADDEVTAWRARESGFEPLELAT